MADNAPGRRTVTSRRAFLSASAVTAAAPLIGGSAQAAVGKPVTSREPDPELRHLLGQVDPDRMEASVAKLVSFGTRHTASSQTDPARGIGAATAWVYA